MALAVARHDAFDDPQLRRTWQELSAAGARSGIFSTYEWCRCWAQTVGRRDEPVILRIHDDETTLGIVPLCLDGGRATRWLRFMGSAGVCGDHLDIVCTTDAHDACASALLDHVSQFGGQYGGLLLAEIQRDSPTLDAFRVWAGRNGFAYTEREPRVVPFLDLPASFDDYLASRSKKMRAHVRRGRRELAHAPNGHVRLDQDPQTVQRVLSDFFDLHEKRWRHDGLAGNFDDAARRQFLRRFCRTAAERGWLRAYTLIVKDEPHCLLLAFHWRDTAYFYQIGRRPHSPIESPGLLVIADSIEQAIREGLTRYDFLQGNESYKFRWTSQWIEQTTLVIGCRLPARAVIALDKFKNGVKHLVQRRFGDHAWEIGARSLRKIARLNARQAPQETTRA